MHDPDSTMAPPDAALTTLRAALDGVCSRDHARLLGRWRGLARAPDHARLTALAADVAASAARRAARVAAKPVIRLDEGLPITARAQEIIGLIRSHQVLVIAGETGSGKTTQLPKLCLAAGRGEAGLIGCTQPRRLAARAVARRVAAELGSEIGGLVGFQVRFSEQVGERALVKFMTDGILLAETQSDRGLSAYDTIILDEAHERSLNIDFLLGYLKQLLARRRDLKLIITSATLDTARFAAHFGGAPVLAVEGRAHPVELRWRPPPERGEANLAEQIVGVLDEISRDDPRGDVLVFLPGEREIRDAHLALARRKYRETEILPLYARLSAAEQDRVFRPGPQRRVVLATNVAETSLTVPRIRYVVDTGSARVKRYSPRSQIERLHVEPIAQSAADQRKGRCGRVGPGICYRLYGEDDYARRPLYADPEIARSSLAGVILRMLALGLGAVEAFPFLDPPEPRAIADGYRRLDELGAIDAERRLTGNGRLMARLPIDVQLARMLVEASVRGTLRELTTIVAFLSTQDPRERPADARPQADAAHAAFADPKSDFVGVLKLWQAYGAAHEELTQSQLRDWCARHFLSFLRMREWRELHRQLLLVTAETGLDKPGPGGKLEGATREQAGNGEGAGTPESIAGSSARSVKAGGASIPGSGSDARPRGARAALARTSMPSSQEDVTRVPGSGVPGPESRPSSESRHSPESRLFEAIHRCILAGLPTQVGRKDERGGYRGTRERKFQVFPGSALAKAPPQWLLAAQILDLGGKVWGLMCARVEPAWIEQQAAHLVRRSWRDARWSRPRGAVIADEQVTLFGLSLVEKRTVTFQRQDPAQAHAIFVREALLPGAIDCRADFVHANRRVLEQAREIEARQRRQGLLKSDAALEGFFAGKLPADIAGTAALDAWYRKAAPAAQAALRWSLADVLEGPDALDAGAYPAALELAGQRLRLDYRFVPGDAADGVTLNLPLALLNAVSAARCEWLVPGLLAEKTAELIRGLPKALRRNFVPAPDFARAFAEAEAARDEPLASALAAFLARATGVAVSAADFVADELPTHLRMRFCVHDEHGATLAEGRDLQAIRAEWAACRASGVRAPQRRRTGARGCRRVRLRRHSRRGAGYRWPDRLSGTGGSGRRGGAARVRACRRCRRRAPARRRAASAAGAGGGVQARAPAIADRQCAGAEVRGAGQPRGPARGPGRGRFRRPARHAGFRCAHAHGVRGAAGRLHSRAFRRRDGATQARRADHRRPGRADAVAGAAPARLRARQLRRPARTARAPAGAGFPARAGAGTTGALPALSEGAASARRTPASRSGARPVADAAGAPVLARVAQGAHRRRRSRRAGRTALADRGTAGVVVRAGAGHRRAGVAQAHAARTAGTGGVRRGRREAVAGVFSRARGGLSLCAQRRRKPGSEEPCLGSP